MKLINLTPIGPDWPRRYRVLEAAIQIITFPLAVAFAAFYKVFDWITDRYVV